MSTITPRFKEELRARVTLSDLIGRKVRLTRAGREFKGCCPFHNEKTPSFYVNDDKQFYHCFGCGAHGDVIGFTMQHENLSFIEAVSQLATEAGMEMPKATPEEVKRAKEEKSLYSLLEDATKWMEAQLRDPANQEAYRYITERGNDEDTLYKFRVGFAPDDRQAVRTYLKTLDYTDKQMIDAGVLRPGNNGGEPYAFFRGRIMFPVPDRRGRVVAFGGRILPDHLRPPERGDYKPAKYMNSSDTPLFHKGSMLYGEPRARQAAIEDKPLIIVEGYMDVIACAKAGYDGALAPLGTALTEEQILVLWRMIPSNEKVPVLCFDGDAAGRRAAVRAAERILPLLKPNQSARFAFLPQGQDPDSLINSGGVKVFHSVVESAIPLVDFLWQEHTQGKNFETPEARAGLAKILEDEVLRIPDRDVQHHYRQNFKNKQYQAFSLFQKRNASYGQRVSGGLKIRKPSFSRRALAEKALLATILNHPYLFGVGEEDLGRLVMTEPRLDQLRQEVVGLLAENDNLPAENLQQMIAGKGFSSELQGLLSESVYTHARFARPQSSEEEAESGWQTAVKTLYQD